MSLTKHFPVVVVDPAFIVKTVNEMDTMVSVRETAAILAFFAKFLTNCRISIYHGEIKAAFENKAIQLLNLGFLADMDLDPLFDHLAAEKERCVREYEKLRATQEEADNKEAQCRHGGHQPAISAWELEKRRAETS
ncbi:MAG: hypothetical protein A3B13_02355 [Candidatus Liptonbacteria bacterium RIFCSPLOWO2_01_FULL_45_15]|uniref:Uncharacterized protein n=1 Tax=Candidatus Liptonbacteria bacterium RIFCSPLOWO2_01_FULL_45_15 TaxID=1798649 RepID=A0A1G2CE23_9BACT|nr:MAG: hypothetical protein A3B13_02355 [Candidatus Liptonbacteria bacterium RIFCSPLOWO2_01_FULL_45_15]